MFNKNELRRLLIAGDFESLKEAIRQNNIVLHKLIRFLYSPDERIKQNAARCFGLAVEVMDEEKIRDLVRRFIWMLNDESGTNSWDIPLALSEIGKKNFEFIKDHMPVLLVYARDPNSTMRERIIQAIKDMGQEKYLSELED